MEGSVLSDAKENYLVYILNILNGVSIPNLYFSGGSVSGIGIKVFNTPEELNIELMED